MPKLDITIFRDFVEDGRTSMEIYADNLGESLNILVNNQFVINMYQPHIPTWVKAIPKKLNLRMRAARYCAYPFQAKAKQGTINHIIDHSYAHLLQVLDPKRSIVTVHDIIPQLAWKGVIPGLTYPHKPFLNKLSLGFLKEARAVIAVSQNTKRDLVNHCGLQEERITVVHNGLNTIFRPESEERRATLRQGLKFPDSGTLLILITGNQSYKNHITSLRVIERLQTICRKPIQLVSLGADNTELDNYLAKINLNNPLIRLDGINKQSMVDLYNSVDCLLFPSWYEGFGWPPLEAMACGTPVVTSNVASLPEIVGDAALMAAPDDVENLTEAVRIMLEDRDRRKEFVESGLKNTTRFTWEHCASEVAALYQKILVTSY